MNQLASALVINKILVALDASPHSLAALRAAADLAARMDAELIGLFVEDIALLRLAEVSCAREVLYFTDTGVPLTRASMESKLRAQSEQVRKPLKEAAQRAKVAWSFRRVRGKVASEVSAAAAGADLLALGRGGWSLGRRLRAGSTALEMAASSFPLLLLPEHKLPDELHLVVYYDGSPAAQRGLLAAIGLARAGMDGVTVLIGSEKDRDLLQAESRFGSNDILIRHVHFDAASTASLMAVLKMEEGGVLVLGSRRFLDRLPPLNIILRETRMPLLLLGN